MMVDKWADITIGQRVRVLMRYDGSGRFVFDGNEGFWYVVRKLAPLDLLLAKHPDDGWKVCVHGSRIREVTSHTDSPDYNLSPRFPETLT